MLMLVIAGIVFVILAASVLAYVFPMRSMRPLASGKIEGTDVTAVKSRINNLFFLPAGDDWIVIDAGSDAGGVKREMERLSIDGRKVKRVFLTHTDYDHVASIVLFPNAAIYMNRLEKQMIDGTTIRQFFKKNRLPQLRDTNKIVWMEDQEVIDFGGHKVRMISVPGHTKGRQCMRWMKGIYLPETLFVRQTAAFWFILIRWIRYRRGKRFRKSRGSCGSMKRCSQRIMV